MAPLCKFYQQGNCRYGANCRFEHPGSNSNPFGSSDGNRFNALNSGSGGSGGAFGRGSSTGPDGTNAYKVTKDAIKIDLADERPQWILSAYGPGRDAPEQLFGGYPREQSFEELRLSVLASSNPQQTLQEIQTMYLEAEKQMQTALGNLDGAVQFILAAEHKHPNRHDICKQNTLEGGANGAFAVGGTQSGFGATLSAASQNPFGASQANSFGTSAPTTSSAFGQSSQMGGKPNPFGQPAPTSGSAFGQPSSLGTGGSAFGQPSSLGAGGSAFGQTSSLGAGSSAFGQPSSLGTGGSAFGQTSSLGTKPNPFAAASNAPSGFAAAAQQQQGSAFGQTSALGAKPNPFGAQPAASPFGATAQSQSGSAFGAPPQSQNANPFGAPAQTSTSSPFGAPSQPSNTGAFGAPSQPSNPSPFGAPPPAATSSPFGASSSQTLQSSPFGAPSQVQTVNPFGAPAQTAAPAANPFGQPTAQSSAFGATPTTSSPFGSTNATSSLAATAQSTPAISNPFGQPSTNGVGSSSTSAVNGAGGFGTQPAAQAASTGIKSPYPPGSTRQHPDLNSYASRMGTRLIRFKNMPVSYKDDHPGVQNGGHWSKIWFPNGPPNYYADTEPQDRSVYTDAVHKLYEDSAREGRFTDVMPEVPPLREDCVWDF